MASIHLRKTPMCHKLCQWLGLKEVSIAAGTVADVVACFCAAAPPPNVRHQLPYYPLLSQYKTVCLFCRQRYPPTLKDFPKHYRIFLKWKDIPKDWISFQILGYPNIIFWDIPICCISRLVTGITHLRDGVVILYWDVARVTGFPVGILSPRLSLREKLQTIS